MSGDPIEVWRMRCALDAVPPEPHWPAAVTVRGFRGADAPALHALLEHAYRNGGGTVAPLEAWLQASTGDDEFDAALWFLAGADGTLAGAALCWTSAFLKDLVVHESWRRRGLGEALLRHVCAVFAGRGAGTVDLKVESTNLEAIRLYERVGFRVVEQEPAA